MISNTNMKRAFNMSTNLSPIRSENFTQSQTVNIASHNTSSIQMQKSQISSVKSPRRKLAER